MINKYYRKESKTYPYVYLIINKTTQLKYYGVRYCNGANPDKFWVDYFTSSSMIHTLINMYGKDDFIFEIRKIFNSKTKAILHEQKVLRRLKVNIRSDFLNKDITQDISKLLIKGKCISIYNVVTHKVVRWPKEKDIPEGWAKGNNHYKGNTITKGRIWCHNPITLESKMIISIEDLPENWCLSRPKEHHNSETLKRKKLIWITNGVLNKQLSPPYEIPEGWERGRTKSESEKINNLKSIEKRKGKIIINNGIINKEHDLCIPIPIEWKKGRLISQSHKENIIKHSKKMKGTKWINNGVIEKKLYPNEKLESGWSYGQLLSTIEKRIASRKHKS